METWTVGQMLTKRVLLHRRISVTTNQASTLSVTYHCIDNYPGPLSGQLSKKMSEPFWTFIRTIVHFLYTASIHRCIDASTHSRYLKL